MSAAGDEGALTFAADIFNDLSPFHSTVESVNRRKQELVYAPGSVQNHTLGTSRPLINLNRKKWVTSGRVHIVAPGFEDPWDPAEPGKRRVFSGGAIIGSGDCRWTRDVVGRFFAVERAIGVPRPRPRWNGRLLERAAATGLPLVPGPEAGGPPRRHPAPVRRAHVLVESPRVGPQALRLRELHPAGPQATAPLRHRAGRVRHRRLPRLDQRRGPWRSRQRVVATHAEARA